MGLFVSLAIYDFLKLILGKGMRNIQMDRLNLSDIPMDKKRPSHPIDNWRYQSGFPNSAKLAKFKINTSKNPFKKLS